MLNIMQIKIPHTVRKLSVDLSTPNFTLASEWEGRVGSMLHNVINPTIERCFDAADMPAKNQFWEKIEIDLGIINTLSDREIRDKIERQLAKLLDRRNMNLLDVGGAESKPGVSSYEDNVFVNTVSVAAALMHFLVYGRLPYWASDHAELFQGDWMDELTVQEVRQIVNTMRTNPFCVDRMIFQFKPDVVFRFLMEADSKQAERIMAAWHWLEETAATQGVETRTLEKVYWMHWSRICLKQSNNEKALVDVIADLMRRFPQWGKQLINIVRDESLPVKETDKINKSTGRRYPEVSLLKTILITAFDQADGTNLYVDADSKSVKTEIDNIIRGDHKFVDQTTYHNLGNRESKDEIMAGHSDEKEFYVDTAGLVIVHPFLQELFRTEKLWQDDTWTSAEAQSQAVRLLGWLVFGEQDVPEHKLTLPKILCGMPSFEPVSTATQLSESQLKSGAELLEAIITHWKVLGKTSVDALRQTFFCREGRVTQKPDGYAILVERKAQDILLNKLPWGISLIHLPWLQRKKIFVEWN